MESGLLNINKPQGLTSYQVVDRVKKILGIKKGGHCGTLDPLAEGVLLVLFGQATRMQSLLMSGRKVYRARFLLGTVTDTGDITGTVTDKKPVPRFTDNELLEVLEKFTGEIEQVPPMYSALKIHGQRLYRLARKGREVPRAPRKITIYGFEVISRSEDSLDLRITCSRGTYIRTLAEDIGNALGCGATVQNLVREQVVPFGLESALPGKELERLSRQELLEHMISQEQVRSLLLSL